MQTYFAQKLTKYLSKQFNTNIYVGGVNVALFSKIILKEVWIEDQNADTLLYADRVSATMDTLSFSRRYISLSRLSFEKTEINVKQNAKGVLNFQFFGRESKKEIPPDEKWSFNCERFLINKSAISYESHGKMPVVLDVDELRLRVDQFRYSHDSLQFRLFSMSLLESSGFYLNELSAFVRMEGKNFYIDDLRLETLKSAIENANFAYTQEELPETEEFYTNMKLELNKSTVNLADAAVFLPQIDGMNQEFHVSGIFSGNSEYIRAKNLDVTTGENTRLYCDVSLNFLSDSGEPFVFVDLKQAQTDFLDLSNIDLPKSSKNSHMSFPLPFYHAGVFSYQGSFSGFLSDFVAYGTLKSPMGQVKTDLSIVPGAKDIVRYNGKIETENFNMGYLLQSDLIGDVTLNGLVNGIFDKRSSTFDGEFDGLISKLFLNNYDYSNITLNGNFLDRKFDGNVSVDDPNLQLSFAGEFDFNKRIPEFDFSLEVGNIDFAALQIDTVNSVSNLRLDIAANFSGNNLDNIDGYIHVTNGQYINQNGELNCDSLKINTHIDEYISHASIVSDFFDLSIDGIYHFATLFDSFGTVFTRYLPALAEKERNIFLDNLFDMTLDVKNVDDITRVFVPGLTVKTPFSIYCDLDTYEGTIQVAGELPGFTWNNFEVGSTDINITPYADKLNLKIRLEELIVKDDFTLENLGLFIDAAGNSMGTRLIWGNSGELSYHGNIETILNLSKRDSSRFPLISAEILNSEVVIADSLWHLSPASVIIDSTAVAVDNFMFRSNSQTIALDGKISEDKNDRIRLALRNIGLNSLDHYLQRKIGLEGTVNGYVSVSDFYGDRWMGADLNVSDFRYDNQDIGQVQVRSGWNSNTQKIDAGVRILKEEAVSFEGRGFIDPASKEMEFAVDLNHFPLTALGMAIKNTFSEFQGEGTGRVVISGTPDNLLLDGAVFAENGGLKINYTQITYTLNDSIRFAGNSIIFNNIRVTDPSGNFALFDGTIKHTTFKNMVYDLSVKTPQILAFNTTLNDNDSFYGRALVSGDIKIIGMGNNIKMEGTTTTLPGTSVTIVLSNDNEVTKYDFVRFVSREPAEEKEETAKPLLRLQDMPGTFEMDIIVNVTSDARAQLLYNTQISDVIKGQGDGAIRLRLDRDNNLYLYGSVNITQGEYQFTLQNVYLMTFNVEPGGSIAWSGDPSNAIVDLSAVYRLKASLNELYAGSTTSSIDYTQRIPVECKIILTDELINPTINFDIVFPTVESRVTEEIKQFFSTPEDLNRQMLSLLVLGRFYTPEYLRGTYEASNQYFFENTASDLLTRQLSNFLSGLISEVDIGVNYRRGTQMTNEEIELALSTQIFNDRVTINGNIGNNANPNSVNNSEIVGDFEVNVKLTRNGKLQLKAYNRANNNLIYETAPYTQGIGISYKEDYTTFGELLRKIMAIFQRQKVRSLPDAEAAL